MAGLVVGAVPVVVAGGKGEGGECDEGCGGKCFKNRFHENSFEGALGLFVFGDKDSENRENYKRKTCFSFISEMQPVFVRSY